MSDSNLASYLLVAQTLLFLGAWAVLDRRVKKHGPIPGMQRVTLIHNRIYALLSLIILVFIASPAHEQTARYLFHASKFYEYLDILSVCAKGATINLHFGFHHLSTPYFTFFRVLQHSQGWQLIAAMNALHHVLMYAYFGGAGFIRPLLDVTGSAQLIGGLGGDLWILGRKMQAGNDAIWPNLFGIGLFSIYLVLWVREIRTRDREHTAPPSKVKDL